MPRRPCGRYRLTSATKRLAPILMLVLLPRIGFAPGGGCRPRVVGRSIDRRRGRHIVSEEGVGIGGAIVTLEPPRLVEYTDQNGAFAFHGVPAGAYVVVIHLGALEARAEVIVVAGQTVDVKKVLPRDFRLSDDHDGQCGVESAGAAARSAGGDQRRRREDDCPRRRSGPASVAPAVHGRRRVHAKRRVQHRVQLARLQRHAVAPRAGAPRRPRSGGAGEQEPGMDQRRVSGVRSSRASSSCAGRLRLSTGPTASMASSR